MHALLIAGAGSRAGVSLVSGPCATTPQPRARRAGSDHDNSSHRCPPRDRAHFGRQCQCGAHASQSHQRSLACRPCGSRSRRPHWHRAQDAAAATRASARSRRPRVARRYRAASGRRGLRGSPAGLASGQPLLDRAGAKPLRPGARQYCSLPQRPKLAQPQAHSSPKRPPSRCSAQIHAAVDVEGLSGDVAGTRTGQKTNGGGDLLGTAEAAEQGAADAVMLRQRQIWVSLSVD